jgi:hypothetical protein
MPPGFVWFLEWSSSNRRERLSATVTATTTNQRSSSQRTEPPLQRPSMKHMILFLAANPLGTDRLALDEECAAIERELLFRSRPDADG